MPTSGSSKAGIPGQGDPMGVVIARLAGRQHGVAARVQLLLAGMAGSTIDDWVRAGHLHRMQRGVYSVVPLPLLSPEARWIAAVLACGEHAVLSHGPAGQLASIVDRRERFALHVSRTDRTVRRIPGVVVHRPRDLGRQDTTRRLGIPTTTPTRTIWDLAYVLAPRPVRRAFEQAEKRAVLDRDRLTELAESAPSRRGSSVVRELLAHRPMPLAETRTRLEEILIEICRDHGLPFPAVNVPLLEFQVDFLWPQARFVVEADGGDHLAGAQRDRDNDRDIRLARAGYLVRRYSWWALRDERAVAAEVLAILHERNGTWTPSGATKPGIPGQHDPMAA